MRRDTIKILIIGADGFVGKHLMKSVKMLTDWNAIGTVFAAANSEMYPNLVHLDITKESDVREVINKTRPNIIVHMAAQSSVALSWTHPRLTIEVNIIGVINILNAVKDIVPSARVLLVGSSEEYGRVDVNDNPITEDHCPNPGNIYAATKVMQNQIGKIYYDAFNLDIIMTRSFNHIGPGQLPMFVISDFCQKIVSMEQNKAEKKLYVGNLNVERDFTDVRDIVEAYILLIQKGISGETYNIGSGKTMKISEILNIILSKTNVKPEIIQDPNKFRHNDVKKIVANTVKLHDLTEWNPKYSIEDTILDTLEYWRNQKD